MSSENYRLEKQDAIYFLAFTVNDRVEVLPDRITGVLLLSRYTIAWKTKGWNCMHGV